MQQGMNLRSFDSLFWVLTTTLIFSLMKYKMLTNEREHSIDNILLIEEHKKKQGKRHLNIPFQYILLIVLYLASGYIFYSLSFIRPIKIVLTRLLDISASSTSKHRTSIAYNIINA